jgi:hypothetical protein
MRFGFLNETVKRLNELRGGLDDAAVAYNLDAIDRALLLLDTIIFVGIFPATQDACESIVDHAEKRWKAQAAMLDRRSR